MSDQTNKPSNPSAIQGEPAAAALPDGRINLLADTFFDFSAVRSMNKMYELSCPDVPTLPTDGRALETQLSNFVHRMHSELAEVEEIAVMIQQFEAGLRGDIADPPDELDVLTALADWFFDLAIYAMSEAAKFGIDATPAGIIMASNFSKLGEDGKPIKDEFGTFKKGPNYWMPEPMIRQYLRSCIRAKAREAASNRNNATGDSNGQTQLPL
jgi:hypothetical protein